MFTTIALCLIDLVFAVFLIYDSYVQANRFGKTQVAVRLRRRVADAVFLNLIVAAGCTTKSACTTP